jgi:hypothetical protein
MSTEPAAVSLTWVLTGVTTILGVLATVISVLFRLRESENAKKIEHMEKQIAVLQIKSDKCDDDRIALHRSDAANRERIAILENMLKEIHPDWKSAQS